MPLAAAAATLWLLAVTATAGQALGVSGVLAAAAGLYAVRAWRGRAGG